VACIPPTLEGWVYIEPIHGPLDGPLTHGLNILQHDYIGSKGNRKYVTSGAYEHCPCSVGRMDAASIVSGNVWGRFHVCWHERFNEYISVIFCRYTNHDYVS